MARNLYEGLFLEVNRSLDVRQVAFLSAAEQVADEFRVNSRSAAVIAQCKYFRERRCVMMLSKEFMKKLLAGVIGTLIAFSCVIYICGEEPVYAAAKKAKKKTAQSSQVIPYRKIFNEYKANPSAAQSKWKGKQICIEGIIGEVSTYGDANTPTVSLGDPSNMSNGLIYVFVFDNINSMGVIEELASAKLNLGQKVKIKGTVYSFLAENGVNAVLLMPSAFPEKMRWQCSKCGVTYTQVTKGRSILAEAHFRRNCSYGGTHKWRRVK